MVVGVGSGDCGTTAFQYSLCRVVLMVLRYRSGEMRRMGFQYSLCRVVLMVEIIATETKGVGLLSVLALSSRFDGHTFYASLVGDTTTFSTRSVESF